MLKHSICWKVGCTRSCPPFMRVDSIQTARDKPSTSGGAVEAVMKGFARSMPRRRGCVRHDQLRTLRPAKTLPRSAWTFADAEERNLANSTSSSNCYFTAPPVSHSIVKTQRVADSNPGSLRVSNLSPKPAQIAGMMPATIRHLHWQSHSASRTVETLAKWVICRVPKQLHNRDDA